MIEVRDVAEDEFPVPVPDEVTAPYFAAAARGEFLLQRSPDGHYQHYPRPHSLDGSGTPEWVAGSGKGTVYTYSIIRQMGIPAFKHKTPYVVAMVELAEGPRMLGAVLDVDPEDVYVGMPVEVVMLRVQPDLGVPFWRPAETE